MTSFTCNAIKQSFLKLLDERPYSDITVRDITEDCGINRNSFYYHYRDMQTLLEEIVKEKVDELIRRYPTASSLEECLDTAVGFNLSNRRMVLHVYQSIERDVLERSLWRLSDYLVNRFFESAFGERNIRPEDRQLLIRYFRGVCFGLVMDWLESGMQADTKEGFRRLALLKRGQTEEMIRRCEEIVNG